MTTGAISALVVELRNTQISMSIFGFRRRNKTNNTRQERDESFEFGKTFRFGVGERRRRRTVRSRKHRIGRQHHVVPFIPSNLASDKLVEAITTNLRRRSDASDGRRDTMSTHVDLRTQHPKSNENHNNISSAISANHLRARCAYSYGGMFESIYYYEYSRT